ENVMKGHPILLNRAPTLHRLGIQAFQPKLIEGKAIQLHPLVCTAFNADFDGDQMAVHLPLGNAAVMEAQILMLASHNILNPANGAPITVPSQDMVLGLYYITKERAGEQGEGQTFYGPQEVIIAYNEGKLGLHAKIKVRHHDVDENGNFVQRIIETTTGRVLFNQVVPKEYGYINKLLTKSSLRDIIGKLINKCGTATTAKFLDDIKNMGYYNAFIGGLSFNLDNVIVPEEKSELIQDGYNQVDEIMFNFNNGFITDTERYNQVIDVWTNVNAKLSVAVMKKLSTDDQGFNSVYMMLDSGARGSKEQISQLCGMRGLMAKPQKAGAEGGQIIENPILANFKEGLSILEYFISSHGARKGLADTALKTADAGYLTRRLVDVAHDVIINEEDCGTLRGLEVSALRKDDGELVESLYDRILGRISVHDVFHPQTNELIIASGEEFTETIAKIIEDSPIEKVEIRSVLTCESRKGVCAKCYGRNLATHRLVQKGEAVGVIAAQSIGEPGTQLTLRTFHSGGVAGNIASESTITAKYDGILEIEELRTVSHKEETGNVDIVVTRASELKILDPSTRIALLNKPLPYGSKLYFKNGDAVKKGDKICEWDQYNNVVIAEASGKLVLKNLIEGVTYKEEIAPQTGFKERIIIESRDKATTPSYEIVGKNKEVLAANFLAAGAHLMKQDKEQVNVGDILTKTPKVVGKGGDITGGLPRVTELFEARNPSNPAVVSEIDGTIKVGEKKRGNREIFVTPKEGAMKKYLVPVSKQILVQDNDYVKAGTPLIDGAITPSDILAIKGPTAVQEYIVNEVQDVYR
ncbi:MAG: DNA-directed RNA polymerase subunit beta', partial [Bacteroidales bacterium]|nr:DNA-directed RNA polymerase subunit beta' [Bacteroidales bacterium]